MALELVAVEGMTVIVDPTSPSPPGAVVATITVNPATGTKVSAGALVHRDGDQISVSAITVPSAGATTPDPGPYVVALNATATKTKAEGTEVLRQDDVSDVINAVPVIPGSPPVNYPVSFTCKISVAGQMKVKAQ
jgi:hypothetical protein